VVEVGAVGTVSQGVVSYSIKIVLDTQNEQIKPGMSVSAAIISEMKADVLAVPNSAVKSQNNQYYVEVLNPENQLAVEGSASQVEAIGAPQKKEVMIGIASDSSTEIISGLVAGDNVVVQTINSAAISGSANAGSSGTSSGSRSGQSNIRIPGF
jgi:hypothetical protein